MGPKSVSEKKQKKKNFKNVKTAFTSSLESESESDEDRSTSSDDSSDENSDDELKGSSDSKNNDSPAATASDDHKPFALTCFRKWDKTKLDACFRKYQKEFVGKGPRPIKSPSGKSSSVDDGADPSSLTVWWDKFAESKETTKKSSEKNKKNNNDSNTFQNWFIKTPTEFDDGEVSWLAGPKSSPKTSQPSTSHIEDIEVPSIYDQKPKIKGRRALKRERKAEREKTVGKKWYEMKAPDVDDQLRNDMELIRMRGVLDPKRFYKHNDRQVLPKYFQMGTVVDEGSDFYSSRLPKKQRKQTLVEELMADANVRQYNKRKYGELQQKMRSKKKFQSKKSSR